MAQLDLIRRHFLKLSVGSVTGLLLPACTTTSVAQTDQTQVRLTAEEICKRPPPVWKDEMGLCLSGGGYRAMLFHVGSLWRLYETGLLAKCTRITSVSGGSITAAVLALNWSQLEVSVPDISRFTKHIVIPIRNMASESIDIPAAISGILLPGNISSKVEKYYKEYLYGDATLQDMPDSPRFIILATNVQSEALFRFSKPYIADYRVGVIPQPELPIAKAVAASSAFPPFLSPSLLKFADGVIEPCEGADLHRPPYTTKIELTDGGVYDNMGLEPLKWFKKVLISDAGGKTQPAENPPNDWARHAYRVLDLIDNQVRGLRKRMILRDDELGLREVAYWSTRTPLEDYKTPHFEDLDKAYRDQLASVPTRLKKLPERLQKGLINWGYLACDATIREHFDNTLPQPDRLPYA